MSDTINFEKLQQYWIESSDKNFITMNNLVQSKDYDWALFVGHLVIEKILKAYFIKKNQQNPPLIHNLIRLAELSGLELTEESNEFLATVTTFNINARYDDYKDRFSKLCTKEFTEFWINKISEYRKWIKAKYLI